MPLSTDRPGRCSGAERADRSKTKTAASPPSSPHLAYQPCPRGHGILHLQHLDHHLLRATVPTSIRDALYLTPSTGPQLQGHLAISPPSTLGDQPISHQILLPASKHRGKLDPFRPPYPHRTDLSVRSGAPSYLSLHPPWLWGLLVQSRAGLPQLQKGPSGSGPAAPSQRRLPVGGVREKPAPSCPAGRHCPGPSEPKAHLQVSREHVLQFALLAPSPLLLLLLIPFS